jgi:hypothetical protein
MVGSKEETLGADQVGYHLHGLGLVEGSVQEKAVGRLP